MGTRFLLAKSSDSLDKEKNCNREPASTRARTQVLIVSLHIRLYTGDRLQRPYNNLCHKVCNFASFYGCDLFSFHTRD